jgi:hypothetical protein
MSRNRIHMGVINSILEVAHPIEAYALWSAPKGAKTNDVAYQVGMAYLSIGR